MQITDEQQRLSRLKNLNVLDTEKEVFFDAIVKIASEICKTPIALISLVDENRQWFKANIGLEGATETPREISFCTHAIQQDEILEVPDATLSSQFKDNPLVTANPYIRFYAGAPIKMPGGEKIGTVCVIDRKPSQLNDAQRSFLKYLAELCSLALVYREKNLATLFGQHQKLTNLIEHSKDAIITKSPQGIIESWNKGAENIYGYSPSEMIGKSIELIVPENKMEEEKYFRLAILQGHEINHFETARVDKSGRLIDVSISLSPIYDHLNNLVSISVISRDISKTKALRTAIENAHEKLRVTMESIGDAVITTDTNGIIEYLNPVASELTKWSLDEALGMPLDTVFNIANEETRVPCENLVTRCLAENRIIGLANHTILISRFGEEYSIEDSAAPIRNKQGKTIGVVIVFHDVTTQRKLAKEISYQATHDSLTGLYNRPEFERILTNTLAQLSVEHHHALLFIDLDRFKVVNDTCGHDAGDTLLHNVTQIVKDCIRASDVFARIGGDEFAILLNHCDIDQAMSIAQHICYSVENYEFIHNNEKFRVGTSIGLVSINQSWRNIAHLIKAADMACYTAKENGRSRVHLYTENDQQISKHQGDAHWAAQIERILEKNLFQLYFQFISPLHRHQKPCIEILIRLKKEDGSLILPGQFMHAVERFHMASRLDKWVVKHTFEWLQANKKQLQAIEHISINLSGKSLGDHKFQEYIEQLLAFYSIDYHQICFEVTETSMITNIVQAREFIHKMHAMGIKFALDDFGSGLSSFGYLKALPVEYIKIDGQFIKNITEDVVDQATVKCIVEIANVTGKKTIAEWVESVEAETLLAKMGVDYTQGFHTHRPAPVSELFEGLKSKQYA